MIKMLTKEQVKAIDKEATRLKVLIEKMKEANYGKINPEIEANIWGRLDALTWIKENL